MKSVSAHLVVVRGGVSHRSVYFIQQTKPERKQHGRQHHRNHWNQDGRPRTQTTRPTPPKTKMSAPTKTVFVTGGTGYIGSHCIVDLLTEGYQVVTIDNLTNSRCRGVGSGRRDYRKKAYILSL
ncbi:hypothetical protein Pmani_019393 [Petrolisthes manimaculis]|uniref:NAD-dependent epimerase/dehydratase domain-containing protein n=1 Tax=Petrolisthes manimaculis TaxID=1843537 RepID=A0AAE1U3L1_9EUCA|nr:hypothetical protein Pmani_019393 [Petrolisthes manimaculis]